MAEIGLDISKEFPKPLTDDAVKASDVVTMGCGDEYPCFPGKTYSTGNSTTPQDRHRRRPADPRRNRRPRPCVVR